MKKLIHKDKKIRNVILTHDYYRFILKNIINSKNVIYTIRFNCAVKLLNLPKNSSKVKSSNRCVVTGRKSGIIRNFKLSRIFLLKLCRSGQLSGIKKSVW